MALTTIAGPLRGVVFPIQRSLRIGRSHPLRSASFSEAASEQCAPDDAVAGGEGALSLEGVANDGAHSLADDDVHSIRHAQQPAFAGKRGDFSDLVRVDDGGAVDAAEAVGGELFLERFERVRSIEAAIRGEDVHDIAFGLKGDNLGGVE